MLLYRTKKWKSEFHNIFFKKDKAQDLKNLQLKLQVQDTYKKDEKITTDFEPINNEDVIHKAHLDEKYLRTNGHISYLEKGYNDFKLQYNKQSLEESLIRRAVKTTVQVLYHRGFFNKYNNVDEI